MSARHEASRHTAPASMQTLMAQIATAKPNTVITGSLSLSEAVTHEVEMARLAATKTVTPAAP